MKNKEYFDKLIVMGYGEYEDGGFLGCSIPKVVCLHDKDSGQSFIVSYEYRKYKETSLEKGSDLQLYKNLPWKDF